MLLSVENIDHLFYMATKFLESYKLHLFLVLDGTQVDKYEFLEDLAPRQNELLAQRNRYVSLLYILR